MIWSDEKLKKPNPEKTEPNPMKTEQNPILWIKTESDENLKPDQTFEKKY